MRDIGAALKGGAALFSGQVLAMAYVSATGFWLRLAGLPAPDVGRYVAAEQVVRAAAGFFHPVTRALLPRMSAATGAARRAWERRSLAASVAVGGALSIGLVTFAGWLPVLLGAEFAASTALVRVLSPIPLLVALSQSLGVQRILAAGRDRAVVALFAAGALVSVAGAVVVAPRLGVGAMAAAAVAAEAAVVVAALALGRGWGAATGRSG